MKLKGKSVNVLLSFHLLAASYLKRETFDGSPIS